MTIPASTIRDKINELISRVGDVDMYIVDDALCWHDGGHIHGILITDTHDDTEAKHDSHSPD